MCNHIAYVWPGVKFTVLRLLINPQIKIYAIF